MFKLLNFLQNLLEQRTVFGQLFLQIYYVQIFFACHFIQPKINSHKIKKGIL